MNPTETRTPPQREGVLVRPHQRLTEAQIRLVDDASRQLLEDPGVFCHNPEAVELFRDAGAVIEEDAKPAPRIRIPSELVDRIVKTAPSRIVLGGRTPGNNLILDAHEPRVRFGSGSETNIWLDVQYEEGRPVFSRKNGSISRLCRAAHLAENLENLDFFIRCVNIQDKDVTAENKDVNKFLASLANMTKHVQAGLTHLPALDDVLRLGEIVAGGPDAFAAAPPVSFIACVVKSPMEMVRDTADNVMAIARKRAPIVVSSCPMGGATAPFDEFGMVAQINAELLAGVALTQLAEPGAPVLYGAVPVRTRLDNLYDMYGAPEFTHYNADCAQMARFYGLPCYSTAGVGDTDKPGIQATVEKMLTLMDVPRSGAQYVHYAFGLLERTNVFCPEQAVMDDAHIGLIKFMLQDAGGIDQTHAAETVALIRNVMRSRQKVFVDHLPMPRFEPVYVSYPLEGADGDALHAAHERYGEILERDRATLPEEVVREIEAKVPGILPATLKDWRKEER